MELSTVLAVTGAIALAIAIPAHLLGKKYDRLMGPAHISEISKKLAALKSHAVEKIGSRPDEDELGENALITSTGFTVLYTISAEENGSHTHHLSISQKGSLLAHTAALVIAAWFAKILSIEASKIVVPVDIGETGGCVRHIIFVLDKDEHDKYVGSEVTELSEEQVKEFYSQLEKLREPIIKNSLKRSSG